MEIQISIIGIIIIISIVSSNEQLKLKICCDGCAHPLCVWLRIRHVRRARGSCTRFDSFISMQIIAVVSKRFGIVGCMYLIAFIYFFSAGCHLHKVK